MAPSQIEPPAAAAAAAAAAAPAAPTAPPTTSSRRQSCDRCYGQKLRCTRQGKEGACNRCLKQGAQCVYTDKSRGFSLPKGRPSVAALARSRTPPTTPAERRRSSRAQPAGFRTVPEDAFDGRVTTTTTTTTSDHEDSKGTTSISNAASTTTSTTSLQWPFDVDWNDMMGDLTDHESTHATSTSLPAAAVSSIDSALSFDPYLEPSNPLSEWTTLGLGEPMERCSSSSSKYGNTTAMEGLNNGMNLDRSPYAAIAQLSQLSTRLYPLHQSGCILAETAAASFSVIRSQQSPLLDDHCLKSVASWFVHLFSRMPLQIPVEYGTKNAGEILQSVFSASHYMLEILRRLQTEDSPYDSGRGDMAAAATGVAHTSVYLSQICNETPNALNLLNPAGHYSHNTIICHLVIACHTLLLNVYVSVLIALQHDADLRTSYLPAKGGGTVEGETQLVMVVQLCAYLLERQRQAVDVYFTPSPPSPQLTQIMTPPTTPPTANREVIGHLEADVRQRLSLIRHTLRI